MKTRTISPRLANGDSRENIYHRLPADIKYGLRLIAKSEGESIGWVLEKVIIDYFGLKKPKYKNYKKKTAAQKR